jgi:hypothetical protein
MLNFEWFTSEQKFAHASIMMDAEKLSKEKLLEIFAAVHQQYQIKDRFFRSLVNWCARNSVLLPAFDELLEPTPLSPPPTRE